MAHFFDCAWCKERRACCCHDPESALWLHADKEPECEATRLAFCSVRCFVKTKKAMVRAEREAKEGYSSPHLLEAFADNE